MKRFVIGLVLALTACGPATLPTPNSPKTAGVEALVAYGLAAHVANQYLHLPFCTSPVTTVPCKTHAIADRMKVADNAAYNAAVAADSAANDPVLQSKAEKAVSDLRNVNTEANGGNKP